MATASSDEIVESTSFMKNTMISSTMVSGEASETDEEDEEEDLTSKKEQSDSQTEAYSRDQNVSDYKEYLENTEVKRDSQTVSRAPDKTKRQKIVYKFDSPLHRKLRERNLVFRTDIVEGVTKLYRAANDCLVSSSFHLSQAQSAAQDVAHNTSLMCEDLNSLSENLDKIIASSFLPSIKTPS